MIRLLSVRARNFVKIKEDSITFPRQGVVVVLGTNLAGRGKLESVGSGKSSLGEAICRALLGVDGRYTSLGHYSRDEEGDTYVVVEAELDDGKILKVEMGYKCAELSRTGEGLRFRVGDAAPIERAHVRDTRAELIQTVGVTPLVADWTVLMDGDRLKFNKLSQTEAMDLLMQSLSQPAWQTYYEKAKKKLDQANEAAIAAQAKLESARGEVGRSTEAVKVAQDRLKEGEDDYVARLGAFEAKRVTHDAKVKEITDRVAASRLERKGLREEIAKINADQSYGRASAAAIAERQAAVKVLEEHEEGWLTEQARLKHEYDQAARDHSTLTQIPKVCPTCKKPWDTKVSPEDVAAAKKKADQLLKEHGAAKMQVGLCRQEINEHSAEIAKLRKAQDIPRQLVLKPLNESLRELEDRLELDENALESLVRVAPRPPIDSRESFKAVLETQKARLETAKLSVDEVATKAGQAERSKLLAKYWVTAFSPAGLPNMALRTVIPPLNEAARTVSNTMTGGVLDVVFEGTTELASGVAKPQLVTKVKNAFGASRLSGNSKGEAGLTNLIIAETQAEVGQIASKVGFRWFDEAVNSEDPIVRRNIYEYLKRQAAERQILIFVVDHNPEAIHYADHVLIANKSAEGLTTFSWR